MRGLIALCIVASNCLLAQPYFIRKDIHFHSPAAVVTGDFNGDHRPDLAVYSWYEGLFVLLNTGGGNFGRPIRTGAEMRSFQFQAGLPILMVADFNGDGRDDLVTSRDLLLSRGDGTFLPARQISNGNVVAVGDFNRDGKIDLLVIEPTGGTRVLLGNGDGTFQPGAVFAPLGAAKAAVADFNRDGRSDVALDTGGAVAVFPGKGDGTFGPEVRTPLRSMFNALPVADFNGDGLPDLVVEGGIALGKGDGSFQSPVPYPALGRDILCFAAADFTGDGKADLVVVRSWTNSVSILPGKGDGTFLQPIDQSVGWGAYPPGAVVDLDGDGRLDLVTANSGSNTLTLLLASAQGGPGLRRAVSSASDTAIAAPDSLATLYAPTTVTASASASPPWPTRLGGIGLEVRDSAGATRLAPLVFVSPTQINFQVPAVTALGEAMLAIASDAGTSVAGSMQVDALAPGLFMVSPGLSVPAATAMRVEPDGTQVPLPVFTCSPSPEGILCKRSPIPLSTAGDRPIYLSFYGTGFRGANLDNVTCSITGVRVPVAYVGPQGTPGVDQLNIRLLPYEALANLGYEVIIAINGVAANTAYIDIQ